jgi:hypothetical protein
MIHEAEHRADNGDDAADDGTLFGRVRARLLAWVAERVAEQRLLWSLRHEEAVRLVHPDDLTSEQALTLVKQMLRSDHDRQRIWLVVNGVLLLASGVLAIVPGPNLVAYYFAFRVVGHWLSMRGAAQGLQRVTWTGEGHRRLTDVRAALAGDGRARGRELDAIGRDLGLPGLCTFVERVAAR